MTIKLIEEKILATLCSRDIYNLEIIQNDFFPEYELALVMKALHSLVDKGYLKRHMIEGKTFYRLKRTSRRLYFLNNVSSL